MAAAAAPVERAFAGRASKIDPYVHLVGELSDHDVGQRAGVTAQNVRTLRRGIPAPAEREEEDAALVEPAASEQPHAQPAEAVATKAPVVEISAEVVAPPGRALVAAHAEPFPPLHGYRILVTAGENKRNFIVVAADMMDAAERATDALALRDDGPWRISLVRELAEALP